MAVTISALTPEQAEDAARLLARAFVTNPLETDRPGNATFYKKFGFEVTGTAIIHGVENCFMRRSTR